MLIDELTEKAYAAYRTSLRGVSDTGTVAMPYWHELSETRQMAWRAAVEAAALGYATSCNVHPTLPFWQLRSPNPKGGADGTTGGRIPRPRDGVGSERDADRTAVDQPSG